MKPTELQIDAVSEAVRHLTAGHHYAEAFIDQWEAIRPPDPVIQTQAGEIARLKVELQRPRLPDPAPTEFPAPPAGRQWHNPENLTPERVGVADGWRLCLVGETASSGCEQSHLREWTPFGYARAPFGKGYVLTYRTKDPLPDPKPTAEETDRAAFEEWANNMKAEFDIELTYCDNVHHYSRTMTAFAAWKASRQLDPRNQTQKP